MGLAPGGKELIDQSELETRDLHFEICGFGAFFRNLANYEFTDDELYGIGLTLEKMSKRLLDSSEKVARSIIRKE